MAHLTYLLIVAFVAVSALASPLGGGQAPATVPGPKDSPKEISKEGHKDPSKDQPNSKGPQVTPKDEKKGLGAQPSNKGPQVTAQNDKPGPQAQPSLKVVPKADVPQKTQAQAVQATEKLQKAVKTSAPPPVARKAPSQTVSSYKQTACRW